jgi:hypothetical protein
MTRDEMEELVKTLNDNEVVQMREIARIEYQKRSQKRREK